MKKFSAHVAFLTKETELLLQKRKPSESNQSSSEGNSVKFHADY